MNYYQNSNNDCYCNQKNNFDYNNGCYKKNNCENNNSCCYKKVEETICCFPSYYNEEKQEDNQEKCFEGTFKICPKHNKANCFNKEDKNDEQKYSHNHHSRSCCFCGFNRFFRW